MRETDGNHIALESTGRSFYAYGGIDRLSPVEPEDGYSLEYGCDGGVFFKEPLLLEERLEIASHMIDLWLFWAAS